MATELLSPEGLERLYAAVKVEEMVAYLRRNAPLLADKDCADALLNIADELEAAGREN
jgi:hypothetical protein